MIFIRVKITCDDDSVGELSAGERVLRLLALHAAPELNEDLPAARHIHPRHGPRDLNAAHLAEPAALLSDVLQNVLVLLFVGELLGDDHVEEAEDLGGGPWPGAHDAGDLDLGRHTRHALGADTRSLYDDLLVSKLHAVQPSDSLRKESIN